MVVDMPLQVIISRENAMKQMNQLMTAFILLILIIAPSLSIGEVIYPVGQHPFGFDYKLVYQKAIHSGELNQLPPVGPFYYSTFKNILSNQEMSPAINIADKIPENNIRFFSIVSEKIQSQQNTKIKDLFSFTGGANYQPSKYFGALFMFKLDRAKAIDPDYIGKKWRGLAGDIETASIYFKKNGLTLTFGRQKVFWGPQPVNLMLSETAEPLDHFSAGYKKGRLQFNFLFTRLDGSRPDSVDYLRFPGYSFKDNRYLAMHRLDIMPHENVRIGFFESSLFGGEGRPPELYYLNPLQFFHTAQLNENMDDNTILGLDFTILPIRGYSIYGQLLVDDFQIDRKTQGDQEPDEIGIMGGLFKAGRTGSFSPDFKIEYTRITNRTYHQFLPRNRYLYRNKLLGHPLGPDSDSLSMLMRFWPDSHQYAEIELAWRRHGEGSILKPWDMPWLETEGDYNESFPTGIVEKSLLIAVRARGNLPFSRYTADHLFFALDAGYGSTKNYHNISGENNTSTWLNFSLSWIGFGDVDLGE